MMERGAIYRVNLEPTQGREQQGDARPCVVLSLSAFNEARSTVVVVPLSSSSRPLPPFFVAVPSTGRASATALCDQVRAIDKSRVVGNKRGALSVQDLADVERSVRQILGL